MALPRREGVEVESWGRVCLISKPKKAIHGLGSAPCCRMDRESNSQTMLINTQQRQNDNLYLSLCNTTNTIFFTKFNLSNPHTTSNHTHNFNSTSILQPTQTYTLSHIMSKLVFTEADHAVMVAIFRQIEVGKIDNERLRQELGLPTRNAAGMRVTRLKAKLGAVSGTSPAKSKPAIIKSNNTKKTNSLAGSPAKKRKATMSDADEEDDEIDLVKIKDDDGSEHEFGKAVVLPESPIRRLPNRQARVKSFVEVEEEGDEDDYDGGEDLMEDLGIDVGGDGSGGSDGMAALSPFDEA